MKNIFKTLMFFIIIVSAMSAVCGQQTADSSGEFTAIYRKAQNLRQEKAHRVRTTIEKYADKNAAPTEKITSTYEIIPPARSRYSSVVESNSKTKKYELIRIGEKQYIKNDRGNWEIDKTEPKYALGSESQKSVKFIEKTSFNNQTVNVYEVESDEFFEQVNRQSKIKYWFSEEGLLLKMETESVEKETNAVSKQISIYEYDPNIKIEAPVISNRKKADGKPK
jgi:hypothetical protein